MEVKRLYEIMEQDKGENEIGNQQYWKDIWDTYVEEKSADYQVLTVKEAIPRLISDVNLRQRRHANNCGELGVNLRIGDICYIDFGEAYINEIGFQHFGLIVTLFHNKAFVVPMSGNHSAYLQAYSKENPKGKKHLMRLGKIKGMNKESVLFINDAKFINTARIIDVKAHLDKNSELFYEIKERVKKCLD